MRSMWSDFMLKVMGDRSIIVTFSKLATFICFLIVLKHFM